MRGLYAQGQEGRTTARPAGRPDINLIAACQSDGSILFTGAAAQAESIARFIHGASGWRHGPFVIVDCGMHERELSTLLAWLLSDELTAQEHAPGTPRPSQNGVVFLRDVEKLSPLAQTELDEWLTQLRAPGKTGPRCRVMASTAGPLLPRSLGGTFNDRLYYRLSLIRIEVEPPPER